MLRLAIILAKFQILENKKPAKTVPEEDLRGYIVSFWSCCVEKLRNIGANIE
jgi:hypothetical protein